MIFPSKVATRPRTTSRLRGNPPSASARSRHQGVVASSRNTLTLVSIGALSPWLASGRHTSMAAKRTAHPALRVASLVKKLGLEYRAIGASSPREALSILKREEVAVLVLDLV